MQNTKSSKTQPLILCGIFAALTAVCSMISIPLPFTPVPINLATLSIFLAGGLLGAKYGALSQIVYVLLGAIGLPVFANFAGGLGVVAGPTGGYIMGYIVAAFIVGILNEHLCSKRKGSSSRGASTHNFANFINNYIGLTLSMIAGLGACYLLGTLWFMHITNTGLLPSLMMCVVPFLIGDALKILAAALLVHRLRPVLSQL